MKRAIVCGATGLIGARLCFQLKQEGYFVRAISRSDWERARSGFQYADEFCKADLRDFHPELFADADSVYQLACNVGGLGYITDRDNDVEMLRDSTLIDINVLEACRFHNIPKVFFASSACVYPANGKAAFEEDDSHPAAPSNEFAWQKLFAERLYQSYARKYGMQVRIARLFNCFGAGMEWNGGKEKSVAALCRKMAEAEPHGTIEVWGNGDQRRSFMYVNDACEGIRKLMDSSYSEPLNIGPSTSLSISELAQMLCKISGKQLAYKYIDGPVGVHSICCDATRMKRELHWEPTTPLEKSLKAAYFWVKGKVVDRRIKAA